MQTMANGLAGHEADFYAYVATSRWLQPSGSGGGNEYSNLNEGLPYWFNGLVPLAYGLNDPRLKAQVQSAANTVLSFQAADGWIGPEVGSDRNMWARTPLLLGFIQLAEADSNWTGRIVQSMRSFMSITHSMLSNGGQGFTNCGSGFDCSWGQARYHDLIVSMQWLLENHPDAQGDSVIWDNMGMLHVQTHFRWDAWYTNGVYMQVVSDPTTGNPSFPFLHGVNVGQGLKHPAVIRRFTHNDSLIQTAHDAVSWTFTYHGSPSGSILADEIQRDAAPYMGSELCTAVETAYSLAYLYHALGDNDFADRAERTIFNALPVMLTGDHWAHQYMDQPNAPWTNNSGGGNINGPGVFTTSSIGWATTYSMETFYPCCVVNHPQGWPKFLSNSWATYGNTGLVHALLSPSTVTTNINGGKVTVECSTAYPFMGNLTYSAVAASAFDLYVRVPSWSVSSTSSITVNGAQTSLTPDPTTGLFKISLTPGISIFTLSIGAKVRTEPRSNGAVSVYVGNVLYSLDLSPISTASTFPHHWFDGNGAEMTDLPFPQLREYYFQGNGNWAVAIDPSTLTYNPPSSSPQTPFVPGTDAGSVFVQGCPINWGLYLGATPDRVPTNPSCVGGRTTYRMVPYGQAKVHMSELPVVRLA
ncbi:hypothetical protein BDN72DRAFT_824765 [Pluteus cervinus]|uniref:Uncharacterized protein n=1 Tax=Pluteus cervinus TaxID=181527 RepID=A0ACD3AHB3_9AGAR|nr:hypothetical protein BDN72DRAFT_824765 [Pluteus cervinus]